VGKNVGSSVQTGRRAGRKAEGAVTASSSVKRGEISRQDVAAVLAELIVSDAALGATFEVVSGATPIPDALTAIEADGLMG